VPACIAFKQKVSGCLHLYMGSGILFLAGTLHRKDLTKDRYDSPIGTDVQPIGMGVDAQKVRPNSSGKVNAVLPKDGWVYAIFSKEHRFLCAMGIVGGANFFGAGFGAFAR